ncbi:MAG: AAA family ATPase [Deltaproteobacteria bacterium]|nr:AAA family ATPase [Deltaproteobacteria bacterium]
MRILAIRGQNLASLPVFEIDLEHGPLAETRIFTITGPTGAGKSTLLDALCLALYDRSPRLFGAKEVLVGDLEVHGADPRSIMRRGATEASAEVDFIGVEGRRLRATWQVWRARRTIDGRIQSQRMRLVQIDDSLERSGATKTETLAEIERSVGLSFTEFCRAALLAQGDFAAFLKASGDERASLLEKMTGTDIYRHLSQGAFRRSRDEVDRLLNLEREIDQRTLMSRGERDETEQRVEQIRGQRHTLTESVRALRSLLEWHSNLAILEQEYEASLRTLAEADRAWEGTARLREVLHLAEQAEALRAVFEAENRATIECAEVNAALDVAQGNEVEAHRKKDDAKSQLDEVEAKRKAILETQEALAPRLAQAKALTLQMADVAPRLRQRALEAESERSLFVEISAKRREKEQELAKKTEALIEIDRGLEASSAFAPLASEWPRWQEALTRFTENQDRIERMRTRLVAAERTGEAQRAEREALAHERGALDRDLESAQGQLERDEASLRDARREGAPAAIQAAIHRVGEEHASIERMMSIVKETQKAERARLVEARRFRAEGRNRRARRRALTSLRKRATRWKTYIESTARDLDVTEAKHRLAKERATLLIPGEPCPLCGSRAHPKQEGDDPGDAQVAALRSRLRRARRRRNRIRAEAQSAREAIGIHTLAMTGARDRMSDLTRQIERLNDEWNQRREKLATVWVDSALLARLGTSKVATRIPGEPNVPDARTALNQGAAHLLEHREILAARARQDEELAHRIAEHRGRTDALRVKREAIVQRERSRAAEHANAQVEVAAARTALQEADHEQARLIEELRAPLSSRPDFPDGLFDDPQRYHKSCAANANAYREAQKQKGTLIEARAEAASALELLNHTWASAQASIARIDDELEAARRHVAALDAQRSTHLGGLTVEQVEASAKADRERAEHAYLEAQRTFGDRSEAAARAFERRHHLEERAQSSANQQVEARARLEAAISHAKIDINRDQLAHILGRSSDWLEDQRAQVRAHQAEIARCQALVDDRRARRDAHRDRQPEGATDRAELEARMNAAEIELEVLGTAFVTQIASLKRDDDERTAVARLEPLIAEQRATVTTWSEMNAIIGSADGKKFRTFAQGLSLDALLFMANRHLADLRPRYRLSRVPGFDMELQITDLDLGEEARSISTLSGGESFLISLALALGLSSLSSQQVEVDSLFIDEGFGSLDEEALETALSVLDQLQAEGRTIGIISHVPEVAERVGYQVRIAPTSPGSSELLIAVSR